MTKKTPQLKMTAQKQLSKMRTWSNQKIYKQIKTREKQKQDIWKLRSVKTQTQGQEGKNQENGLINSK